jgi:hypothetical protein
MKAIPFPPLTKSFSIQSEKLWSAQFKKDSNSKQPSLIWFQLSDVNGDAYKGTTVSSVMIPSTFVIDQFRDAVVAKYLNTHLKRTAPSDLHVYKSKAAFDAKEIPLKSSLPLNGLGETEEDAVIVIVPPPLTEISKAENLLSSIKIDSNPV